MFLAWSYNTKLHVFNSYNTMFLGSFFKNIQQIYRRTPCWSATSKQLQRNFLKVKLWHEFSPVNLLYTFRTLLSKNTCGRLILWCLNYLQTDFTHGTSVSTIHFEQGHVSWVSCRQFKKIFSHSYKSLDLLHFQFNTICNSILYGKLFENNDSENFVH